MQTVKSIPRSLWITFLLSAVALVVGFLGYRLELALPATPDINNTYTSLTQPASTALGSYDVLGHVVSPQEAAQLQQEEAGREQLLPENGAVKVTEELLRLGRRTFYSETFGNEVFQTDVVGALKGPVNLVTMTKAIAALGGKPTTNLQVPVDEDFTVGGRTFKEGTMLNTGLDVPARSLLPLGLRPSIAQGKLRVGITCAACHAAVDNRTGRVLEGAPNNDLDSGLILALATNSAAMFRQTSVNPTQVPPGEHTYINADGKSARLPDAKALENAVDAALLTWPPGNFDSSGTLVNNPSQNPPSYTFENYPYGWSGFSSVGWFHGLTTLNNNVHATNSYQSAF